MSFFGLVLLFKAAALSAPPRSGAKARTRRVVGLFGGTLTHVVLGSFYCVPNLASYMPANVKYFSPGSSGKPDALLAMPLILAFSAVAMPVGARLAEMSIPGAALAGGGAVAASVALASCARTCAGFLWTHGVMCGTGIGRVYGSARGRLERLRRRQLGRRGAVRVGRLRRSRRRLELGCVGARQSEERAASVPGARHGATPVRHASAGGELRLRDPARRASHAAAAARSFAARRKAASRRGLADVDLLAGLAVRPACWIGSSERGYRLERPRCRAESKRTTAASRRPAPSRRSAMALDDSFGHRCPTLSASSAR